VLVSFPARDSDGSAARRPTVGRRQRGRAGASAPARTLPVPVSSLVGRGRELAHIAACLQLSGAGIRLLSLVGSPGTGKTRLGIEAARELVGSFEQGVYFVDLSAARDDEDVPTAIAHVLGATYAGRRQVPIMDTLKRVLRDREVLLVLDNFESVLSAGALLEELLAACPRIKVLVTTREPLRTQSEQQLEVAPLATPDAAAVADLDSFRQVESVTLFRDRTRAVHADWEVSVANAAAVAEICVRLDGLPLAIELAAAWMNVLTAQAMVPELPHALRFLGGRGATRPSRHQTLQTTIEWSYDRLSDQERTVFRRAAVFELGWSLDAFCAVCGDPGAERTDDLMLLGALVDKHLVGRTEAPDGSVRFGLLETRVRIRATG
jgi:predicted ATPase